MKTPNEIYEMAADWLCGVNTFTPHDIIEEAVESLKDVKDNQVEELYQKLVFHVNLWNGNSLAEQVDESVILMEDITGYLGAYLDK